MIGKLTYYVLRHRAITLALLVLFVIAGISAFRRLPVEAYPDVTNVSFQIITLFPGHAAEEVERLVTIPIENEMNGIPHRTSIRSVSQFGLSQITLVFEDGTDNEFVRNQAAQHLAVVNLPPGAQASLSPDATPVGEIYRYTLEAPKGFPKVELKAIEDWVVERQFRTVPGVVDVNGFGDPTDDRAVVNGVQTTLDELRGTPYIQFDLRVARPFTFAERWKVMPFAEFFNLFNRNNPGANYVTNLAATPLPVNNLSNATAFCLNPSCTQTQAITSLNQLRVPAGALGDFFGPGTTVGIPFAAQLGARLTF